MNKNQRVKIEAPTLEHLFFSGFEDEYPMLDIIDAPNLVSLEYIGNQIPKTFVNTDLQWSCHPTRFILSSTITTIARFMDRLMYMKSSSHSTSNGNYVLHSQLKEVKAYKFDHENHGWHHVQLESGNLLFLRNMQLKEVKAYKFDHENQRWHHVQLESGNLLSLRKCERFCFILDW
ncbi:hypothetical protein H5410_049020 [Solanum commersonii]|uniref:Uncharacterized protein n=1 Tax=Solanum commersonii TaxID=4109 RepID=A0A9J5XLD4_SOLCO|nr:hypothetical protein H5410_049020 [Solanum commersonii]